MVAKILLASLLALFSSMAYAAAVVSLDGLVSLVIYLLILGAVMGLLLFIIRKVEPPEPLAKWLPIAVYVVGALILIAILLDLAGSPVLTLRR